MKGLTARQKAILQFLDTRHRELGFWPSIREIQQYFQFKSTNAVMGHLKALEVKGALVRIPGHARAYQLNIAAVNSVLLTEIPVYGKIPAGYPDGVEGGHTIDTLKIDMQTFQKYHTRRAFALKVRGDSMIDAGIQDGDMVIVDPVHAKQGDVVAALIDGETTLKRLVKEKGHFHLKAENKNYPHLLPVSELIIQGVAKSLLRPIL